MLVTKDEASKKYCPFKFSKAKNKKSGELTQNGYANGKIT